MKLFFCFSFRSTFPKSSTGCLFTWGTNSVSKISIFWAAGLCWSVYNLWLVYLDLLQAVAGLLYDGHSTNTTTPQPVFVPAGPQASASPDSLATHPMGPVRVGKCLFSLLNLTNTNSELNFISEGTRTESSLCPPLPKAAVVFVSVFMHTLPSICSWTNI